MIGKKLTTEEFITFCSNVHNNFYDYSKTVYVNDKTKVLIICPIHGEFKQFPSNHKRYGCNVCARKKRGISKRISLGTLKNELNEIHGNRFNYDLLTEKVTQKEKVKIKCKLCNLIFVQTIDHHKHQQCGCPHCLKSKGEQKIINVLNKFNLKFTPQKTFVGCKNKKLLPFDFYLDELNILIEYDGVQHFKGWSNDNDDLKSHQLRDKIKNSFCAKKNIRLIRIPYTEIDNIEEILKKHY